MIFNTRNRGCFMGSGGGAVGSSGDQVKDLKKVSLRRNLLPIKSFRIVNISIFLNLLVVFFFSSYIECFSQVCTLNVWVFLSEQWCLLPPLRGGTWRCWSGLKGPPEWDWSEGGRAEVRGHLSLLRPNTTTTVECYCAEQTQLDFPRLSLWKIIIGAADGEKLHLWEKWLC